ncbi:Phospho-N-acetylmuramoyl-pentapeptide-transferase [Bienertia sinuspersici]
MRVMMRTVMIKWISQGGREKNKRSWTKAEEKKANGNFKSGFRNKIEEELNKKFPGCGLKSNPYIESKMKWFKDKYNVLADMFLTSVFSWDKEKMMIFCERQFYDDYCKVIPPLHLLFQFLCKPLRYN